MTLEIERLASPLGHYFISLKEKTGARKTKNANNSESNDRTASKIERKMQQERTHSPTSATRYPTCAGGKMVDEDTESTDIDSETNTEQNLYLSERTVSVRFERSVTVRFTRSHRDYTDRQIKDCWYQPDELQDILTSCSEEIEKSEVGEQQKQESNDITFCLRGLEYIEELAHKQKVRLRAEAATTVFTAEEQGCNEKQIATRYSAVTARSQTWANIMGLRDQRDATSIHEELQKPIFSY